MVGISKDKMVKILIIDDEAPIRKMFRKLFEQHNYNVLDAVNGKQGMDIFKEQGADLIITDLLMPEKDGLETIREIRKLNTDIKIIAISGGGLMDQKMYLGMAKKFGAHHIFTKPVDNDELLSTVKRLLGDIT